MTFFLYSPFQPSFFIATLQLELQVYRPNFSNRMEERRWAWAFLGFGLASWIQADSFFIEIPALYTRLPEGAALSTDLVRHKN